MLSARKTCTPKQAGTNLRVARQIDLHCEGAARGIGGWNDLRHLALDWLIAEGVDYHWDTLTQLHCGDLALIHLRLEPETAGVLDDEQGNSRHRHSSRLCQSRSHNAIEGGPDPGETNRRTGLGDTRLSLGAAGVCGIASCLCSSQ